MPNAADRLNLIAELKSAAATTILPLLQDAISETEADGFLTWAAETTAEIAITGEFELLEEIKELVPLKLATYKLRAAATANAAIANGLGVLAKIARAGLLAAAGPIGGVLGSVAGAVTPPPAAA